MDKTVYYIPDRNKIVSVDNIHKYKLYSFFKNRIEIPNDPIMHATITVKDEQYVVVEYKLGSTIIKAMSKTNPNYIIKNCTIDDGVAYGPFIWAKQNYGMELIKVNTEPYYKAKEQYETEHKKRIRKFVVGGIYKRPMGEYQYLGVCKYYKQSIDCISPRGLGQNIEASIILKESPMWLNLKYKTIEAYKCPRIYEQVSTEKIDVEKLIKNIKVDIRNIEEYTYLSIANTIHIKELTGNIKEYIEKFKDNKRIFRR